MRMSALRKEPLAVLHGGVLRVLHVSAEKWR